MKIQVKDRQSPFDIAIQYCGKLEEVIRLAISNDLSLTDELSNEQSLTLDHTPVNAITTIYASQHIIPATALDSNLILGGIGFMGIEINFKVQ